MSSTGAPVETEVDDLGPADVLARVGDAETAERRAALRKLELALQWCVLHPATAETGAALWGDAGLDGVTGIGRVERLGPATADKIRGWLASSSVTVVPVLDLERDDAVDQHDPPEWMRETVTLRDVHCVFPWCERDARTCDLDHIEPYVPLDQGGPPGQTAPSQLAPLCRRHHHAKTSRRWRYRRRRDGSYRWLGPHGAAYLVTPVGTTALTRP